MRIVLIVPIICSISIYLGWLLTESPKFSIAQHLPIFDRKPFNCRPCTTFHIIWMLGGCISTLIDSILLFVLCLLCAFIAFGILYIRDKNIIDK